MVSVVLRVRVGYWPARSYAVTLDMNDGDYLYFSVAPNGVSDTVDIEAGLANTFLIATRIGA